MKKNSKELRYLVRCWTDYYNDHGKYKVSEKQFSDEAKAVAFAVGFVTNHDQAVVIDLLLPKSNRIIWSSSP